VNLTADELLEQAKAAFLRGREAYRDAMLEAGRLLHEFILARLREGEGLDAPERVRRGLTRRSAVRAAGAALAVSPGMVSYLVATWAAVTLLGQGGPLGAMRHATAYAFRAFVRRAPADGEAWSVRPEYADAAVALFRRAVAEGWGWAEAADAVGGLRRRPPANPRPRPAVARHGRNRLASVACPDGRAVEVLSKSAALASPGDLADMLFELLKQSEDPVFVAERLLERARGLPKRRAACAAAGGATRA
jgi:hypothetical protein